MPFEELPNNLEPTDEEINEMANMGDELLLKNNHIEAAPSTSDTQIQKDRERIAEKDKERIAEIKKSLNETDEISDETLDVQSFEGDKKLFEENYRKAKKGEMGMEEALGNWLEPGGHGEQHFAANSAREMLAAFDEAAEKEGREKMSEEKRNFFIASMINDAKERGKKKNS